METKIVITGAGGQGILFGGMVISQAALEARKFTTYFPSYGAEIRGGSSMACVIIADEPIGSPIVESFDGLLALNGPGYNRFIKKVAPGGIVVVNASLVKNIAEGSENYLIPASELATKEVGNIIAANMITIGYYARQSGILSLDNLLSAVETFLVDRPKMLSMNKEALKIGYSYKPAL